MWRYVFALVLFSILVGCGESNYVVLHETILESSKSCKKNDGASHYILTKNVDEIDDTTGTFKVYTRGVMCNDGAYFKVK